MKNFVGIDLGTTNSAICSYDGDECRIWKSPEQNDVTPSVIYIDRRGNKYVGKRAYDSAPYSPDNSAMLFKRLMGTSTPVELSAVNLTKTPEECSAEILKMLFGYLPEEIRNDEETGTVITVPAAFNQMQKDATMQAAEMAGIGSVALMQEPVAAVMSVMRTRKSDGIFLIYDLGGGTLDIAIAESGGGRVTLFAHGGIAMCGGRDFDRMLVDNVVKPWLFDNFDLPDDLSAHPNYKTLMRLCAWATERAKIELSSKEEAAISLSETESRVRDESGNEVYLDITLERGTLDKLIEEKLADSIEAARETLTKAGLTPHDVERVVFIGGPTHYKPLRDKVAFELGIPGSSEVNPMVAVAEGAALFAESIDWSTKARGRKNSRGTLSSADKFGVTFNYIARTPDQKAKIAVQFSGDAASGTEFQVDSLDTGWTSGRLPLKDGKTVDVALSKSGDNQFKVFLFDSSGGPISLEQDKITITQTAATVEAIPASHSIGIEVLEKLGGRAVLDRIVRAGDPLPIKGRKIVKAAESLKAGGGGAINFKLWEGEIDDPITDNRPIGTLKIAGNDFDDGVITAGAEIVCDYEVQDSGNVVLQVSVPSIGGTFHSGHNFYSRQGNLIDFSTAAEYVKEEGESTISRVDEVEGVVENPKLDQARNKLGSAMNLDPHETDPEVNKQAMDNILEAKKLLAAVRKENLKEIRQLELDGITTVFNEHIRELAKSSEEQSFDNLARTAQRAIDRNDSDFENHLGELKGKNFTILWRQDWFVVEQFKWMIQSSHLFPDKDKFDQLSSQGVSALQGDDIEKLKQVIIQLNQFRLDSGGEAEMFDLANIIRG